jgi:hypothetical protein
MLAGGSTMRERALEASGAMTVIDADAAKDLRLPRARGGDSRRLSPRGGKEPALPALSL